MAEVTTGVRSVLSAAAVYSLMQRAVGARRSRRTLAAEHLRAAPGTRILDIGCGTGEILEALPAGVDYLGVDHSARYVEAARKRFGDRARFEVGDAGDLAAEGSFDLVLCMGVMHHLDDDEVRGLVRTAAAVLAPGGRFVATENAWVEGQPRVARWLIERDRGANVRTPDAYRALAGEAFGTVEATVRHDMLRVPYTLVVLEASAPAHQGA